MGTNYYSVRRGIEEMEPEAFWAIRDEPEGDEVLHIGKSSGGWCFTLHVMPERGIEDLWNWFEILIDPERVIIDEYHQVIPFNEMMQTITGRSWPREKNWTPADYERNNAEPGPNNLARHRIGRHCRSHGLGTWDCVEGRFS